jgi:predicted nucleic acid-binding protein
MSVIILLETLRDLGDQKRLAAKALLESFSIVNLDNSIIEAYCRIYRVLKEEGNLSLRPMS